MGFISYKAIAAYITSRIAAEQISIPAFRNLILQGEPTVLSTCCLMWTFTRHHSLKSKLAMIWIIASAVFVLSFSTIIGAMISYSPDLQPSILVDGLNRLSLNDLYLVEYIIHDGQRIGKTSDYAVLYSNQSGLDSWSPCTGSHLLKLVVANSLAQFMVDHALRSHIPQRKEIMRVNMPIIYMTVSPKDVLTGTCWTKLTRFESDLSVRAKC